MPSVPVRPTSKDEAEEGLWSSMLNSVATGKRLPEKTLVVLGGTPETQKELLDTLDSEAPKRSQDRHNRKSVVANDFALGYTYQNVLDADHEDTLARLSVYLLSDPSPSYSALLSPLLTSDTIPKTLLVILLDWNEPWSWIRQLRQWISIIREVTASLKEGVKATLEATMTDWQERRRGTSAYDAGTTSNDASVSIPLGQGEWDEPLGLPLCVVCQHAEKINTLEAEEKWREEDFDFVLQSLRTVLMKHGASLIYTSTSQPGSLPALIHSSLDIHSMLKKQILKHNVIDREKILVPPNWDSWGKIRVIREGFDVEGVSRNWSEEITFPIPDNPTFEEDSNKVLRLYETTIPDPHAAQKAEARKEPTIEVVVPPWQQFMLTQQDELNRLAAEDEKTDSSLPSTGSTFSTSTNTADTPLSTRDRMASQIGPVEVNVGGIQVNADDMAKRFQDRARQEASSAQSSKEENVSTPKGKGEGADLSTPEMKAQNERLQNFFSDLLKRGPSNSPRGTPSKAPPSK